MPKITKPMGEGFGKGELYTLLLGIKADLAEVKSKYDAHCHLTPGASGTGTKPSTGGATESVTPSSITLTVE